MNKNPFFSVLVVSYKPEWEKLRLSLLSIIEQDFTDYEIIICDDGSENPLYDETIALFKEHNIDNFRILPHDKNQGTVRNMYDGAKEAKGLYITTISPGDLFFDKKTLFDLHSFLTKTKVPAAFGLLNAYRFDSKGNIIFTRFDHPYDLDSYRKKNYSKIEKNLIMYTDHVCGAAMIFSKDYLLKYLGRLVGTVVYEEDIMQVLSAVEGVTFSLFERDYIWYEKNAGVSATSHSPFELLLAKDVALFYEMMLKEFPNNKWIVKRNKLAKLYKIRNIYLRTFLRFFINPGLVFYLFDHFKQVIMSKPTMAKGFLNDSSTHFF